MLYIERSEDGSIAAIHRVKSKRATEEKPALDPEVLEFLKDSGASESLKEILAASDSDIIRVVEDLVDLLIHKKIIIATDLPQAAQEKLRGRKSVRESMHEQTIIVDDIL